MAYSDFTLPQVLQTFHLRMRTVPDLFAGVEKWRGRRYVGFEGSYGFGRDRIASGWLQASLRELDQQASDAAAAAVMAIGRSL